MTRPPLVLTGGPAVGKTVTEHHLATRRARCAVIDVDDVRQLIVSGGVAPWSRDEGVRQRHLGVANTCALAANFRARGFEVSIADVLTPDTARQYRRDLPDCLIVHLAVAMNEARRRAATRTVWLTDDEFEALHDGDHTNPPDVDRQLRVDDLDEIAQAAAVEAQGCTPDLAENANRLIRSLHTSLNAAVRRTRPISRIAAMWLLAPRYAQR